MTNTFKIQSITLTERNGVVFSQMVLTGTPEQTTTTAGKNVLMGSTMHLTGAQDQVAEFSIGDSVSLTLEAVETPGPAERVQ